MSELNNEPGGDRKAALAALSPFEGKDNGHALLIFCVDLALFLVGTAVVAFCPWLAGKLAGSAVVTLQIARLFIVGHDACHNSFTSSRTLNQWIGRVAFLPSLTPYSLWEVGHNVVHHGFANLKGRDYVWTPFSKDEYDGHSRMDQLLERFYRTGYGAGLYYFKEIWWRRLVSSSAWRIGGGRRAFGLDLFLVFSCAAVWLGGLAAWARWTHQSLVVLEAFGFLLPFLVWNGFMGFVVYVHHTHPEVAWYDDPREWAAAKPHISTTVHVVFPYRIGSLLHNIMEHPAHHADMRVPLYRLNSAESALECRFAGEVRAERFTLAYYRDCTKRCKLYDYRNRVWLDFAGNPTSTAAQGEG